MEALKHEGRYTYADYCTWDDDERWEIIDGVPYLMSPAPLKNHQHVCGELFYRLRGFLEGKQCKVYIAPFDVRLNADKDDDTIVQPDLVVICDYTKLYDRGCVGAPDMVIEVLSKSTAPRDKRNKLIAYQNAGVREYWIVDPDNETVRVNLLGDDGKYSDNVYTSAAIVSVNVLEGCQINLREVFEEM